MQPHTHLRMNLKIFMAQNDLEIIESWNVLDPSNLLSLLLLTLIEA